MLECEPAAYAALAANEAEKAAQHQHPRGARVRRFGRVYLGGEEKDIEAARPAAVAALESLTGRTTEPVARGAPRHRRRNGNGRRSGDDRVPEFRGDGRGGRRHGQGGPGRAGQLREDRRRLHDRRSCAATWRRSRRPATPARPRPPASAKSWRCTSSRARTPTSTWSSRWAASGADQGEVGAAMNLAKVVGTRRRHPKEESLDGLKFLLLGHGRTGRRSSPAAAWWRSTPSGRETASSCCTPRALGAADRGHRQAAGRRRGHGHRRQLGDRG